MNTTLAEAKHELDQLIEARADLQRRLELAFEEPNAEAMIKHRRALDENSVHQYAQRAKIIRLQKTEDERQRQAALEERESLNEQLSEATKQYSDAIAVADEKRVAMQTLQVKLFSTEQKIETHRQDANDHTRDLRLHIANWKTQSMVEQLSAETACDL